MGPRDALTVKVFHIPGCDVIEVSGELDIYTQVMLRQAVVDTERTAAPLTVIDLNGVAFLDSQGVACLATARRLVSGRGGQLVLAVEVPRIRRLLQITGLDQVLTVVSSVESFSQPQQGSGSQTTA